MPFSLLMLVAIALGAGCLALGLDFADAAIVALAVPAWLQLVLSRRRRAMAPPPVRGAPEPTGEGEFTLEVDGARVTVHRRGELFSRFEFRDVLEIQCVRSDEGLSYWRIVTAAGAFLVPRRLAASRAFAQALLHRLPGFFGQRTVSIAPPPGFTAASSWWRLHDPHPPEDPDEPDFWW